MLQPVSHSFILTTHTASVHIKILEWNSKLVSHGTGLISYFVEPKLKCLSIKIDDRRRPSQHHSGMLLGALLLQNGTMCCC